MVAAPNEGHLVRRGVGHEQRFELLYREYAPRIRALLRQKVADPELVEDLVQDTFFRALRAFDAYDPRRPTWPWLSTIASRAAINALSKKSCSAEFPSRDVGDQTRPACQGPFDRYLDGERRRGISEALESLNSRHRRLLFLQVLEGWRYEEIADLEGTTTPAVKSALSRARRTFRDAYEQVADRRGLNVTLWPVIGWIASRFRKGLLRLRVRMTNAVGSSLAPLPEALAGQTVVVALAGALALGSMGGVADAGDIPGSRQPEQEGAGAGSFETTGSERLTTAAPEAVSSGPAGPPSSGSAKEVTAVAEVPRGTGVGAEASGRAERGHLTAKVWAKTPRVEAGPVEVGGDDEPPIVEWYVEVDCDKNEFRRTTCDTVDDLPDGDRDDGGE